MKETMKATLAFANAFLMSAGWAADITAEVRAGGGATYDKIEGGTVYSGYTLGKAFDGLYADDPDRLLLAPSPSGSQMKIYYTINDDFHPNDHGLLELADAFERILRTVLSGGLVRPRIFFVGNMLFERHEVGIDVSESTLTSGIGYDSDPVVEKRTVFLQVLCDGAARLYFYNVPNIKDNFFFSTEANPELQYLVNKEYLTDGRTGYLRENHTFRNQLYAVFAGKVNTDDLKNVQYTETDLVSLFDQYNGTESVTRRRGKLNLDIRAAYRPAKMSGLYGAALSLEYVMPFNRNKWSVLASIDAKIYDITDPQVSDKDKLYEAVKAKAEEITHLK